MQQIYLIPANGMYLSFILYTTFCFRLDLNSISRQNRLKDKSDYFR